jgi:hypothetical protein
MGLRLCSGERRVISKRETRRAGAINSGTPLAQNIGQFFSHFFSSDGAGCS